MSRTQRLSPKSLQCTTARASVLTRRASPRPTTFPSAASDSRARCLGAYSDLQNSHNDSLCVTPIPRPSHQLPDGFSDTNGGVSAASPSSPSLPTLPLSSLPVPIPQWSSEESISETVVPSLLSPPPQDAEGLGLFLQPISVDPPPSPLPVAGR